VDAAVVFENYARDPAVAKYVTWKPHRSLQDTIEFLRRCERSWVEASAFPWSLWLDERRICVDARNSRSGNAVDLGYALARRWWRQGLMLVASAIVLCPARALAQERVSLSTHDRALIYADLYGTGPRGVVLAHGGQFNKESWREQARILVAAGFRVLAIDFRGLWPVA
jgi:RimJ/RimL family protein N-acetyltransferase